MCPITSSTLAAVSIASTVLGAGMTAYGQVQASNAANKQAQYQAQVAESNAVYAEMMAADARERGKIAADNKRQETAQRIGKQTVTAAAAGVDVASGTPNLIIGDTAAVGELDALTIRNNAEREAYGYQRTADNYRTQAGLASANQSSPVLPVIGTALASTGSVAEKWYKFKDG